MCVDVKGCPPEYPTLRGNFHGVCPKIGRKHCFSPLRFRAFRKQIGGIRRFSRETQGTRGTVLNRIAPQFPNSHKPVLTII